MANISSAYGSMTLKGIWPSSLITSLNTIASEIWAKWCYGIQLDYFEVDESNSDQTVSVFGDGRWTFESNLKNIGACTAEEVKEGTKLGAAFNELIFEMNKRGLTIEVSYSDEEGGCLVLYRQTGVLSSDGKVLVYTVTSEEHLDYNWENYMDVTGDSDLFEILVENLCKEINLENDCDKESIERWAMTRTLPYQNQFDDLDESKQIEFREVCGTSLKTALTQDPFNDIIFT